MGHDDELSPNPYQQWVLSWLESYGLLRWVREPRYAQREQRPSTLADQIEVGWGFDIRRSFVTTAWQTLDSTAWVAVPTPAAWALLREVAAHSLVERSWFRTSSSFFGARGPASPMLLGQVGLWPAASSTEEDRAERVHLARTVFLALRGSVQDPSWLLHRACIFATVRIERFPSRELWLTPEEARALWVELLGPDVPIPSGVIASGALPTSE